MAVHIALLGHPHVVVDNENVHIGRSKAIALLAYLLVNGKTYRRETLATLFWADYDDSGALAELRRHLSTLKKAIPAEYLTISRSALGIQRGDGFSDDVMQFQNLLRACQSHEHDDLTTCAECATRLYDAAALYQGEFMAGFTLPDSPEFANWQYHQQFALSEKIVTVLETLAHHEHQRDNVSAAIDLLQRLISVNKLHEPAHQLLMRLYAEKGQRSQALTQYELCIGYLHDELGVQASEPTHQLYQQIRDEQHVIAPVVDSTIPPPPAHTIPLPDSRYIGRDTELQLAYERITDPTVRLLTIVGLGGIGKTHFALEIVRRYFAEDDGIYYVPLAARSSEHLASAIAEQLNFNAYSNAPLATQLRDYLRNKRYLIILDNFEHLADDLSLLEDILSAAPHITLLLTSRRRLGLNAEWVIELHELDYPTNDDTADDFAAGTLFLNVAQRMNAHFQADMSSIAQICRIVQGLPLAIELIAARTRIQSVATILKQLQAESAWLNSDDFDLKPIFTQSWELLSTEQQAAFQALAIFPANFTTEAAVKITQVDYTMLRALIDHSVLHYDVQTERYHIHPLLRGYLLEQAPPTDTHKAAFADFYTTWLKQIEAPIIQRDLQHLRRVEREIDNIRLALQFAIANQQLAAIEQALIVVYRFYDMKKWLDEGAAIFQQITMMLDAYIETEPNDIHAARWLLVRSTARQAGFAFAQGEYETTRTQLEQYLPFLRDNDDMQELSFVLNNLGMAYGALNDLDQADSHLHEALQIRESLQDTPQIARTLNNLALVARRRGDHDTAWQQLNQGLALYTKLNDYVGIAVTCNNLGNIAYNLGKYQQAHQYHDRCLKIRQKFGLESVWGTACTLHNLGLNQQHLADKHKARELIYTAYTHFKDIGHVARIHFTLLDLAQISHELGQQVEAQRYLLEALQNAQTEQHQFRLAEVLWAYVPILTQQGEDTMGQQILSALRTEAPAIIRVDVDTYIEDQHITLNEQDNLLTSMEQIALDLILTNLIV